MLTPEVWQITFQTGGRGRAGGGRSVPVHDRPWQIDVRSARRAGAASTPTRLPTSTRPEARRSALDLHGADRRGRRRGRRSSRRSSSSRCAPVARPPGTGTVRSRGRSERDTRRPSSGASRCASRARSGTWLALIDAHSGAIRSFTDDNKYAQVEGRHLSDLSRPDLPRRLRAAELPDAFRRHQRSGERADARARWGCSTAHPAGPPPTTTLSGQYIKVNDNCGTISQSVTCSADLDLQGSAGMDCVVPAGSSAGNTHAARSSYYHLNRIAEHARTWLPTRTWLTTPADRQRQHQSDAATPYWNGTSRQLLQVGRRLQQHRRDRRRVPPRVGTRAGPERRRRLRQSFRGVRRRHRPHGHAPVSCIGRGF